MDASNFIPGRSRVHLLSNQVNNGRQLNTFSTPVSLLVLLYIYKYLFVVRAVINNLWNRKSSRARAARERRRSFDRAHFDSGASAADRQTDRQADKQTGRQASLGSLSSQKRICETIGNSRVVSHRILARVTAARG